MHGGQEFRKRPRAWRESASQNGEMGDRVSLLSGFGFQRRDTVGELAREEFPHGTGVDGSSQIASRLEYAAISRMTGTASAFMTRSRIASAATAGSMR